MDQRNHSIEALRIWGAGAVLWFHLGLPDAWIAMAALHLFVILAIYFGRGATVQDHARRLLVPWILWSGIYGGAKVAQAILAGTPIADEFSLTMLLTGASLHLWFLPFTFGVLALSTMLPPLPLWRAATMMAIALVLMRAGPFPVTPLPQWGHVLPAAVLGLWMAGAPERAPVLPLALTCFGATALTYLGFGRGIEQTAVAAGLCLIAFCLPLGKTRFTQMLAPLSFGVYLSHPLIVALLMLAGITNPWVLLAFTMPLSFCLSAALRRLMPVLV